MKVFVKLRKQNDDFTFTNITLYIGQMLNSNKIIGTNLSTSDTHFDNQSLYSSARDQNIRKSRPIKRMKNQQSFTPTKEKQV